jgi:hypothetical protein
MLPFETDVKTLTFSQGKNMKTLKEIREKHDLGLLTVEEIKGTVVRVGFLTLTVQDYEETPGDGLPNKWHLEKNGQKYVFTPYNGLTKQIPMIIL